MTSFQKFLVAAKALNGSKLPTIGGRSFFILGLKSGGFTYTPSATGHLRNQSFNVAKDVFERNLKSKSFKTSDYTDITRHTSYILSLLRIFQQNLEIKKTTKLSENKILEGLATERHQLSHSRNRKIAGDRKKIDNYTCQVCSFNLKLEGRSIIECHHLHPIGTGIPRITTVNELITLCPTCHRFAHLRSPPPDLPLLRTLLGKSKK